MVCGVLRYLKGNSGQVRIGQVGTGQVRTSQFRTGQFRTAQVRSGQIRTGQSCPVSLARIFVFAQNFFGFDFLVTKFLGQLRLKILDVKF